MEIYKKTHEGFEKIGREWTGFPSNGIWEVQDGSQSLLVQRKDIPTMPPFLPALKSEQDNCTKYIYDKAELHYRNYNKVNPSRLDYSRWAAEFYAGLLTQEDYPELFL